MTIHLFGLPGSTKVDDLGGFEEAKAVLGGKGAGLSQMSTMGLPVPPGLTLSTETCVKYMDMSASGQDAWVEHNTSAALDHIEALTEKFGYTPLLSVRSGARVSMPGMMDTILNVGLTEENFEEWADRLGDRAALDSLRRLCLMFGSTACGLDPGVFNHILHTAMLDAGVKNEADLPLGSLREVCKDSLVSVSAAIGGASLTLREQLSRSIRAVWDSWMNDRAVAYRKMHGIPNHWGTAVNIQAMVFGNMNDNSGSGVLFTRNPSTGEDVVMGEFLPNAQGEDVVAGIRTPLSLSEMEDWNEAVYGDLLGIAKLLENHHQDMQDIEFTVQDGKLFILQTRTGKRSAEAAFKIAWDFYDAGTINAADLASRVSGDQFSKLTVPKVLGSYTVPPTVTGIGASGFAVTGRIVFTSEDAVSAKDPVILVRKETTPDDIKGMAAAVGVLTQTGGATSHAAVVARGMDKACVVGVTDMTVGSDTVQVGETMYSTVAKVTIDGATGRVWFNEDVPLTGGQATPEARKVLKVLLGGQKPVVRAELERKGDLVKVKVPYASHIEVESWVLEAPELDYALTLRSVVSQVLAAGHVEKLYVLIDDRDEMIGNGSLLDKLTGSKSVKAADRNLAIKLLANEFGDKLDIQRVIKARGATMERLAFETLGV